MERFSDDSGDSEMTAKRDRVERSIGSEAVHALPDPDSCRKAEFDQASVSATFDALVQNGALLTGLPDLSVSPGDAATLTRRRWSGAVEVVLPTLLRDSAGDLLTEVVERHLKGREPFAVIEGSTLLAIFSVEDRTESILNDVRRFALGLANLVGGGQEVIVQQAVRYVDSSEYDHLAPEERWPFSI